MLPLVGAYDEPRADREEGRAMNMRTLRRGVPCLTLLVTGCGSLPPMSDAQPALAMRAPLLGGVPVSISFNEAGDAQAGSTPAGGDIAVYLTFPDEAGWVAGDFDLHYTVVDGGQPDEWKKALSNPPSAIYSTSGRRCFFRLYAAENFPRTAKVRIWATRTDPPFNSEKTAVLTITR
jgi:hypothetical protein